jgi:hypothetical protein
MERPMTLIPVTDAARSIRNDYLALPRLSLTRDQTRRLYGLDPVVCDGVLAALVDVRFLERTGDGRYVRADRPMDCPASSRTSS